MEEQIKKEEETFLKTLASGEKRLKELEKLEEELEEKEKRRFRLFFFQFPQRLRALNLPGAQATRANVDRLAAFQFYLANIGLPGSVGFSVRVRYITTECNALSTYFALCHL